MPQKPICKGIFASGQRCRNKALDGGDHCYSHSPDRAEERRKNAALGGAARSRQSSEVARIEAIDRELKKVTQDVLAGRLSEDAGRVTIQGLNARLRATKVKQETVEFEDYGRRISELERRAAGSANRRGVG